MTGFLDCLTRLVPEIDLQDKISFEFDAYRSASSLFGLPIAVRQRKTKPPAEWWFTYGCSTPNLQKFAMRVLSLTCSAIGCERNWDGFQLLRTKKKNKLAQGRLNDLVFVKFNRALQCRYSRKDPTNPILLEEIDDCNEWLLGKMDENSCADEGNFVLDGDNSNWGAVGGVVGTCDPSHVTAASRVVRHGSKPSLFKANRGKGHASSLSHKTSIKMMTSDDESEMEEYIGVDDVYVDDSDEFVDLSLEELPSDEPRQKVKSSVNPIPSDTPRPSDLQLQGNSNHLRRSARHKVQRL